MPTPNSTIRLDYCAHCGGALELVDGTDPDRAARTGEWKEMYRCTVCKKTGLYTVNQRAVVARVPVDAVRDNHDGVSVRCGGCGTTNFISDGEPSTTNGKREAIKE